MDAFLAVVSRREVRDYDPRPPAEDAVRRILEAGRLAGSSRNRQARRFVAIRDRALIDRLADAVYTPSNLRGAPLVVVVLTWGKGPTSFDAGRAAQNMMLTAWAEGVGSCPNGIADPERCHAVLEPRDGEQVATIVSFGYPARPWDPGRRSPEHAIARADRQPFDAVVEWR